MYLLAAPSCHAQDLLDPVQNVSRIQAGALHLAGDLLRQHVSRIRLGRLRCDALDGAVVRVFEVDPAGAAFQLAPAVLHLGDGVDALSGLASDRVAHAGALAVIQIRDNDADSEGRRREALGGPRSRFGWLCSARAQESIDGRSDGAVAVVEVLARAGLVGIVAVHGHVAAVGVVDAVGLVGGPDQLLDAVALANVGYQLDQCSVGCIGHGVGVLGVAGDFDGDGAVVVLPAGSAPGAIRLIDGQADGAILADDVVGAALAVSGGKKIAALLRRPLAHDAVDRNGVDGVVAGAGLVLGDVGVRYQRAVAHGDLLLLWGCCSVCVGVVVCLAEAGPLYLDGVAHVGRALVLGQHDVGRLLHGPGCPEYLEDGHVALQLLEHEVELHHQVADGRAGLPGVVEHGLLAAPVCPLREAVAGAVADEVGVAPGVHGGRVLGVREAQAPLVGVLEVYRIEPALGVEVAHQPGHTGRAETFAAEVVPDGPLGGGPCRLHGLLLAGAGVSVALCLLLQDVDGLRHDGRDRHAHQSGVFDNADRLIGDEGDDRRVSDECGARDQIEAAGYQHHQESRALTAETLPSGAALQGAVCGLLGSVKHAGNDEAGDVVHAHEDQERGQSCVPASEKAGDEAAHDSHCCANSSFHVVYLPSFYLLRIMPPRISPWGHCGLYSVTSSASSRSISISLTWGLIRSGTLS